MATVHPAITRHASGKARVRLNGKDFYGPAYGNGRRPSTEAVAWHDELVSRWLSGGRSLPVVSRPTMTDAVLAATNPDPKSRVTVAEVAAGYLRHALENSRRGDGSVTDTHKAIQSAFRYLEPWYRVPASKFDLGELVAVRKHVIATGGRTTTKTVRTAGGETSVTERVPPARSYVNDVINRIRAAFAWAAVNGLISPTVVVSLTLMPALSAGRGEGARETPEVGVVPDSVFFATLPHLPRMAADILRVLRLCGARPGEVCSMRLREIIREDSTGAPLTEWRLKPSTHKTWFKGIDKEILFSKEAQEILTPYLAGKTPEEFVFEVRDGVTSYLAGRRSTRKTPLTPSARQRRARARRHPRSGAYTTSALRRSVARACERARIPHWHPNQARHATLQEVRDEHGIEAAQAVGSHRDLKSTQRYAGPSQNKGAAAVAAVGRKHRKKLLPSAESRIHSHKTADITRHSQDDRR